MKIRLPENDWPGWPWVSFGCFSAMAVVFASGGHVLAAMICLAIVCLAINAIATPAVPSWIQERFDERVRASAAAEPEDSERIHPDDLHDC